MRKAITTFILGSSVLCHAQTLDQWMAKKHLLLTKQTQINDSLKIVEENIQRIKIDKVRNESAHKPTIVRVRTPLTKNPINAAASGEVIRYLESGDTVEIFAWKWSHLRAATRKNELGYVSVFDVDRRDDEIDSFIEVLEAKFMEEYRQEEAAKEKEQSLGQQRDKKIAAEKASNQNQERAKSISGKFGKYGTVVVQNIIDGKVWVGMSAEMAKASWGNPQKINKTITSGHVKEQWVYKDDYLYFEGGSLVAIQTSR